MIMVYLFIEIGWLTDSVQTQETSGSIVLQVGVREGAERMQENITFSVESFPGSESNNSGAPRAYKFHKYDQW